MTADLLNRFFQVPHEGERVIGTYLYPLYLLGEPNWEAQDSPLEVIGSVLVEDREVLITRMSGLFVRPPTDLADISGEDPNRDFKAKIEFQVHAASVFNRVICEFCLLEVISEPASPAHISAGRLIDGHALIVGAGGGREMYLDRTAGPSREVLTWGWRMWPLRSNDVIRGISPLRGASRLAAISVTLPEFVAGAYSQYSQGLINEAVSDSWVVCEQIIDYLWQDYRENLADQARRRRLGDHRTYSVGVRLEVLAMAGVIAGDLYAALNLARNHRNNLLHRAENSLSAASECLSAMKLSLERVLGYEVAQPMVSAGINW